MKKHYYTIIAMSMKEDGTCAHMEKEIASTYAGALNYCFLQLDSTINDPLVEIVHEYAGQGFFELTYYYDGETENFTDIYTIVKD